MKKLRTLIILTILLLQLLSVKSVAQPSAVLVLLKAEKNKIDHFTKVGDVSSARSVKQERDKVINATMVDFVAHFDYCPVYYFMDTSLPLVLERKLDGILFNEEQQIHETSPLNKGYDNFVIVYYGIPPTEVDKTDKGSFYQSKTYPSDGMVILDNNFKRRPGSYDHYLYEPDMFFYIPKKFAYTSKLFSMEYKPYATYLQKSLQRKARVLVIESK
jgi:hypothetical protein